MKTKELLKSIGSAESTTIEWKQSLSEMDGIIETTAAFANTEGGRIFIGISPEGKILGVQTGTSKIIQWCKEWGLPEPTYEEAGGSFVTVFHNPKPEGLEIKGGEKVGEKVGEKGGEKVGEKLSLNQQKILEIISKNPMVSAQQLAKMVGISQRKIEENIAKLKSRGYLKRIGPDKGGRWEIFG